MVGQDPKGDQSSRRASDHTQGLEQGLPGIKGVVGWWWWGGDGGGVGGDGGLREWVDDGVGRGGGGGGGIGLWSGWWWGGQIGKVGSGFNGGCRCGWCASVGGV